MAAASGNNSANGNTGREANGRKPKKAEKPDEGLDQLAGKDADRIVAEAYKEAARIMEEAKQRARYINSDSDNKNTEDNFPTEALEGEAETREIYERVDELFAQIRYQLAEISDRDRMIVDQLLDQVNRLEYYVDTLVVDSLKLRNVRYWLHGTTTLARRLRARLDR